MIDGSHGVPHDCHTRVSERETKLILGLIVWDSIIAGEHSDAAIIGVTTLSLAD